jgi:hypothetical protein
MPHERGVASQKNGGVMESLRLSTHQAAQPRRNPAAAFRLALMDLNLTEHDILGSNSDLTAEGDQQKVSGRGRARRC